MFWKLPIFFAWIKARFISACTASIYWIENAQERNNSYVLETREFPNFLLGKKPDLSVLARFLLPLHEFWRIF